MSSISGNNSAAVLLSKFDLTTMALPAALIIMSLVFSWLNPVFFSGANIVAILHQSSIVGIMALAMTFVIMTGGIDLSVGPVLAISGVICAWLLQLTDGSVVFAIAATLLICSLIGALSGTLVAIIGLPAIVVTLAVMSIVRGAGLLVAGPSLLLIREPESFLFIGSGLIANVPVPVYIFVLLAAIAIFVQKKTTFGILVLATGDNQRAAFLSGHNSNKIKIICYALCALGAAIAGIIQASQVHTAAATYGAGIELDVIAAVVLGGTSLMGGNGTMVRTVMGVLMIGIINNGLGILNVPVEMQLIAKGCIIICALLVSQMQRHRTL
ncbi:ABC transporter permease [Gammaproteobacteria bacterium AS21]|jgi:ribose/xylose/arabinose/galactoside ABC-type transport system permease subunit